MVKGFWLISMYDEKQRFVDNPIQRYAIGGLGRHSSLVINEDGSLDIYIRPEAPGAGKEMNWLPAPAGVFNVFIRLYSPDQTVLDGTRPMLKLCRISWLGRAVLEYAPLHFQVKGVENLKGKAREGKPAWFPLSPAIVAVKPLCARRASALLLCPQAGGR